MKSVFETLSAVNVNGKVEKKNGLSYLSWAWAWGETKKLYPKSTYKVMRDPQTDKPWFCDPTLGYMVMTEVTIEGETLEMWLPVMDGANKAMLETAYSYKTRYGQKDVEKASMFDINKTIMRCLTKNLAMFGLGHYIYAGEDIPESSQEKAVSKEAAEPKQITLKVGDDNWKNILKYIAANKKLGAEKIVDQVSKKYKVTATVKKAINEAAK